MSFYTVSFQGISVTAAQDLFSIVAATNRPFRIHELSISQSSSTTSTQVLMRLRRLPATVTAGSGGASITAVPSVSSDVAASVTARRNDTTGATTSGTAVDILAEGVNMLSGWKIVYTPDPRPTFSGGEAAVIRLESTVSLTMNGYVIFEELA